MCTVETADVDFKPIKQKTRVSTCSFARATTKLRPEAAHAHSARLTPSMVLWSKENFPTHASSTFRQSSARALEKLQMSTLNQF
jgi:hypothetical protein